MIGHHEWKVNIVGMSQEKRTGPENSEGKKGMKKNSYKAVMWQHTTTESLCNVIWPGNNIVHVETKTTVHIQLVVVKAFYLIL